MDHAEAHERIADLALEPRRVIDLETDPTPEAQALLAHVRTGVPEDTHIWIVVQGTEGIQGRCCHWTSGVVRITIGVTLWDHVVEIRDRCAPWCQTNPGDQGLIRRIRQ